MAQQFRQGIDTQILDKCIEVAHEQDANRFELRVAELNVLLREKDLLLRDAPRVARNSDALTHPDAEQGRLR